MRWAVVASSLVIVVSASVTAYALSCDTPGAYGAPRGAPVFSDELVEPGYTSDEPGVYAGGDSTRTIPVDGHPWLLLPCDLDYNAVFSCELVSTGGSVPVTLDTGVEGGARCERFTQDYFGGPSEGVIARLVPAEPLSPETEYTVDCMTAPIELTGARVRTRADATPARDVPELAPEVNLRRSDGCCYDDYLEAELTGLDGGLLEETGFVEIRLPDGPLIVITEAYDDLRFTIPNVEGDVSFTAVTAAGVRGPTITVTDDERGGDLVYIPCTVGRTETRFGAWLLLPLLLLVRVRRRER